MRVTLALAFFFLLGCLSNAAESDPAAGPGVGKDGPGVVSTFVADPQGSGYMLAFPMDEAGMVAAESAPVPQIAEAEKAKEDEPTTTPSSSASSSTSAPEAKTTPKPTFQQPSEADRRRKIEEMRKILGLPAQGQKPKPVPVEKSKPLLFPTLLKVLPRLDGGALGNLPLSLIRRSDEEGPKMLHGLLRQAASVFMRRALLEDEPETQDVNEKGKKDSMMFLLDDDDKEDSKENQKKGGKDDDDDDDDDDIAFIPIPRPMIPIPTPFRRGLPLPPFGLPQRPPHMFHRRPMPPRGFPPMGPPPQARMAGPRQPNFFPQPHGPTQPVMLMLHPVMVPQPMMMPQQSMMPHPMLLPQQSMMPHPMLLPQQSMMHPMAFAHPPGVPHPMLLPPPPPQFQPHPFLAPHPMMVPQHQQFLAGPQLPHPHMLPPPGHQAMMVPHHQPQMSAPQPVLIRPFLVPDYRPVPVPVEGPEESEESPYMVVYEDAQPRFQHNHPGAQQMPPQFHPQFQPQPPQVQGRSLPAAILSPLRRMQILRELIMARSLQSPAREVPRVAFHPPVPPRIPQGEREVAQSIFRPIFMPMGL